MIFSICNRSLKLSCGLCIKISVRKRSWKVLFFGTDHFSICSLKELHGRLHRKDLLSRLDVVTTVGSKPNPVMKFAAEQQLSVLPWPPSLTGKTDYDFGVVVSFGHLIPKTVINSFPLGMINVHSSLLPRWRGASPAIHAMLHGDTATGISIMRIMPHHFDTGNIILQKSCSIDPDELYPSLLKKLSILGASCLMEAVSEMPDCLNKSVPQNELEVTYAPKINTKLSHVNWTTQTATQVYNLYRALFGLYPPCTHWRGAILKFKDVKIHEETKNFSDIPGTFLYLRSSSQLRIQCRNGVVSVQKLIFKGKVVEPRDFYNGYLSMVPKDQWIFS